MLQVSEEDGSTSIEALMEITQNYGEIWSKCAGKLIYVCSEIMKNKNFGISPRQSALEIISTLAESNAKILRDNLP